MTDEPAIDPEAPAKTHTDAILELAKTLLNSIVKDSEKVDHVSTPMEKLKVQVKDRSDPAMVGAISALSAYGQARASERMATAMETIAKTVKATATDAAVDTNATAMIDLREPKREYLATTYRLDSHTLSLLWAIRGMLIDAALKSLSVPSRFDPYLVTTTEQLAYSLKLDPEDLLELLPKNTKGEIDYRLLEEFEIMRYGGTDEAPDDFMYGG